MQKQFFYVGCAKIRFFSRQIHPMLCTNDVRSIIKHNDTAIQPFRKSVVVLLQYTFGKLHKSKYKIFVWETGI